MRTHFSKIIFISLSLFTFACGKDKKSNNQEDQKEDRGIELVRDGAGENPVRPPVHPIKGKWVWSDDRAYSLGAGPAVVYHYDVRADFSATFLKLVGNPEITAETVPVEAYEVELSPKIAPEAKEFYSAKPKASLGYSFIYTELVTKVLYMPENSALVLGTTIDCVANFDKTPDDVLDRLSLNCKPLKDPGDPTTTDGGKTLVMTRTIVD